MTKKVTITAGMCVLLISSLVAVLMLGNAFGDDAKTAGQKVVLLKDGKTFTGTVTGDKETITIKTKFGKHQFSREQVRSIKPYVTPMDEYLTKRTKIDTANPEDYYKLANWVWEKHSDDSKLLRLAEKDLGKALELQKNYPRATLLKRQIAATLKILDAKKKKLTGTAVSGARPPKVKILDKYLLSDQDIYWIRLMELRKNDKGIGIQFKNDAQNRFIEAMEGSGLPGWDSLKAKKKFRSQSRFKQAREMLLEMPNEYGLLKDIHVTKNPKFFIKFRRTAWVKVRQFCATPQCHGGPKVNGGLKFFVLPGKANDRVNYTNFIILVGSSSRGRPLIDRDKAADSLLLQYGLTPKVAKFKHPKINGQSIKPAFSSVNDPTYKSTLKWIKSLKGPVAPDYHLEYVAPFGMKLNTAGMPELPVVPKDREATDTVPSEPLE
ncbi:MAG: hypothetical protein KAR11_05505 [Phycisphaerae bacterium]|nr:hypothetical protein [Phycisphaerae bacterium]